MNEPDRQHSRPRIGFITNLIGSGFYSGYSPIAPGTAGSLVAVGIYLLPGFEQPVFLSAVSIAILFLGAVVASQMEKALGEDPPAVVIDEFVGQWLTYIFLPKTFWIIILGFFLFRIYDIIKPQPARALEKVRHGWGIMLDDVIAGVYANLTLQILIRFFPLL